MSPRTPALALLATLGSSGCCVDLFKIHLPDAAQFTLPDGGFAFDGGGLADLLYEHFIPDPAPLYDGGTVTYGNLTVTTSFDGGARLTTVSRGGTAQKIYTDWSGDGTNVTGTGDLNLDGRIDYKYTSLYDGVSTYSTTILTDTNFDGVFDKQDVWAVDVGQGTPYQKTETVSRFEAADGGLATTADGGSWVQAWTYTGPAVADMPTPGQRLRHKRRCNGYVGFPDTQSFTGVYTVVPKTLIKIVTDDNGFPGACSSAVADKVAHAIEAALEDIALCFDTARPSSASDLAIIQQSPLVIGCGNSCDGTAASTEMPQAPDTHRPLGYLAMNLNPSVVMAGSSLQWTEEILLHELLHFAGHDHDPPPTGNPPGHDMVYGCGRYCVQGGLAAAAAGNEGGCQTPNGAATIGWGNGTPSPAAFAFDCADCADDAHRHICGVTYDVSDCSTADCGSGNGDNTSCPAGTVCCAWTALNCWGNQVASLGDRDPTLQPGQQSNCNQTQCDSELPAPNCDVGNPVDLGSFGVANCTTRPIGWCQ